MGESYKHADLTQKIIGCAMKVHSTLGNGFPEVIYQRALGIEFEKSGVKFSREVEMPVFYERKKIGIRRVDFFVEETVLIELKARIELENGHLAQALNYLEAFGLEVGLLINFGSPRLEFRRLINSKNLKKTSQNL